MPEPKNGPPGQSNFDAYPIINDINKCAAKFYATGMQDAVFQLASNASRSDKREAIDVLRDLKKRLDGYIDQILAAGGP
jgi:hypothetical protein